MKDEKNEFLGLLCNLYLVILLAVLPLYTGDGYWQLGDTKYMLFRNLSLLCLGGWLLAGMPGRVGSAAEQVRAWIKYRKTREGGEKKYPEAREGRSRRTVPGVRGEAVTEAAAGRKKTGPERTGYGMFFSRMDRAMAAYGICVVLSACCSSYGKLAWNGYEGWYMGAFSQLMFIGIYFFVSRQYGGAVWPIYLGEAALFLVTLLGLLHRLGIDPLGLMAGWNSGDWEYSHLLSTLGNINWLCGYYSVALAFVIVHYLQEDRRWLCAVLYLVSVAAFVLLLVQGSQSGLLILGTCAAVCFVLGRRRKGVWGKTLLLLTGTFLFMPLLEVLMKLQGSRAAVVADGNIFAVIGWYGWLLAAAICLFFFLLLKRRGRLVNPRTARQDGAGGHKGNCREGAEACRNAQGENKRPGGRSKAGKPDRMLLRIIAMFVFGTAVTMAAGVLFRYGFDDGFGSGRGFLWRISAEGFAAAGGKDKLLGAGPDCYGEAIFGRYGTGTDIWKGEHWEGAVFTNAHNEFLNQMCNVGILGTVSYLAIFLVGMRRYGDDGKENVAGRAAREAEGHGLCGGLGLLALSMYGIHATVSFQQVLNAPLLFLVLGLCEAETRRKRGRMGVGSPAGAALGMGEGGDREDGDREDGDREDERQCHGKRGYIDESKTSET